MKQDATMNGFLLPRPDIHLYKFFRIGILTLLMTQTSYAIALDGLRSKLPQRIGDWSAAAQDRIFDATTIFSYINGGAEVYKAYNMKQCFSRRYATSNGPAIILDIFDMGSSKDAYGVFTHDTDGDGIDIGQDGRFRPGWLSFWKNRFFVSIYMEEENEAAEKAVIDLGKQIDAIIVKEGTKPRILLKLPVEGLKAGSIRYLHHPVVLNYHYYLSDENILNISEHTEVVLATYQINGEDARLLLATYPELGAAHDAYSSFLEHYLPDADRSGIALLENQKWSAIQVTGRMLCIVLDADSRHLAVYLLKSVR